MQQHPDYKYRPRRKPKALVKSPSSNGHSNGTHNGSASSNNASHHHHSSNNNNNNDSRSSNNNLHHNSNHHHHHHSLKSTSPIMNNHFNPHHHHHQHHSTKYPFVPTIELPISFPTATSQHSQQQVFPSSIHYPLVDPTVALDLQARLHAMYMNAYYPWRLPLISTSSPSSPSQSNNGNHYTSSPKISPTTTTTNSPPLCEPDTQTTII